MGAVTVCLGHTDIVPVVTCVFGFLRNMLERRLERAVLAQVLRRNIRWLDVSCLAAGMALF